MPCVKLLCIGIVADNLHEIAMEYDCNARLGALYLLHAAIYGSPLPIRLGSSFAMLGLTIARRIEWLKANGGYPPIKLRYNNIVGSYGISLNIGPVAIPMAALLITLLIGFIIAW